MKLLPPEQQTICPEGYTIDLYCRYTVDLDHDMYNGESVFGHNRADARRVAKSKGWKLHNNGTATCPACVRRTQ